MLPFCEHQKSLCWPNSLHQPSCTDHTLWLFVLSDCMQFLLNCFMWTFIMKCWLLCFKWGVANTCWKFHWRTSWRREVAEWRESSVGNCGTYHTERSDSSPRFLLRMGHPGWMTNSCRPQGHWQSTTCRPLQLMALSKLQSGYTLTGWDSLHLKGGRNQNPGEPSTNNIMSDMVIRCFHRILAQCMELLLPLSNPKKTFRSSDGKAELG